ncbi:uncharacterized protein LOC111060309 [Nilaparvata lugens]|uniref:uncharacterized protein LOC111060309 n=1 Tax=Nilaparvata lugens TaxID=108931 RepID=UPI00193E620B|nr:uncharacterized protein LOC111060309 [Nilaparvata lugens]
MTPVFFNDEDDVQLIKLVRSQNFLWNLKNPDFRKKANRDATWARIAKVLNKPRIVVQKRWKSIRDHHRRQLKDEITTGTCTKKRATYFPLLSFLEADREEADNSYFDEDLPLCVELSLIRNEDTPVSENYDSQENNNQTPDEDTPDTDGPPAEDGDPQENNNQVPDEETPDTVEPPAKRLKASTSSMVQHLVESEDDTVKFRKLVQYLVESKMSQPQEDDIDVFFKSMAMTVKKFKPHLISKTKMKVCQLVMEMEALNEES